MGLLDEAGAHQELARRQDLKQALVSFLLHNGYMKGPASDPRDVLKATLSFLSLGSAPVIMVNLEDLWLESEPQNIPGTGQERPNWRRKARHSFEVFSEMPQVVDMLREVNRLQGEVKGNDRRRE